MKSLDGYESYGIATLSMFVVRFSANVSLSLTQILCAISPARRVCVGSEVDDWKHSPAVSHLPVPSGRGDGKYKGVHEGQSPFRKDGNQGETLW